MHLRLQLRLERSHVSPLDDAAAAAQLAQQDVEVAVVPAVRRGMYCSVSSTTCSRQRQRRNDRRARCCGGRVPSSPPHPCSPLLLELRLILLDAARHRGLDLVGPYLHSHSCSLLKLSHINWLAADLRQSGSNGSSRPVCRCGAQATPAAAAAAAAAAWRSKPQQAAAPQAASCKHACPASPSGACLSAHLAQVLQRPIQLSVGADAFIIDVGQQLSPVDQRIGRVLHGRRRHRQWCQMKVWQRRQERRHRQWRGSSEPGALLCSATALHPCNPSHPTAHLAGCGVKQRALRLGAAIGGARLLDQIDQRLAELGLHNGLPAAGSSVLWAGAGAARGSARQTLKVHGAAWGQRHSLRCLLGQPNTRKEAQSLRLQFFSTPHFFGA